MKQILKELKEQAQELIDCGNSHEKAKGQGMMEVIKALSPKKIKEQEQIEKAGNYLVPDGEVSIKKQIKLIEAQAKKDNETIIDNIEGVEVWEKLQFSLTCKDFLDLIGDYE